MFVYIENDYHDYDEVDIEEGDNIESLLNKLGEGFIIKRDKEEILIPYETYKVYTNSKYEAILELQKMNIKINKKSLFKAIDDNDLKTLELLITVGVDIESRDYYNRTPLNYACYCYINNLEIVKYLTSTFPNIDIESKDKDDCTALNNACFNGNLEMVEFLVSKFPNIDIESKDKDGYTPLNNARYENNLEIVEYLKSKFSYLDK